MIYKYMYIMFLIFLINRYFIVLFQGGKVFYLIVFNCFFVRLNEIEFMEFFDIENYDDFYIVEEGRIYVQDQRGYYIVYDSVEKDFK